MGESTFVGIDFGSSQCRVAHYAADAESPQLLCNAEEEIATPSAVYLADREARVGRAAEVKLIDRRAQPRVMLDIKRDLPNSMILTSPGGWRGEPVELARLLFAKLKRDAEVKLAAT